MRRVLIIGPSGAGKSTLARSLAPRLGLPLVHLDQVFWQPGWVRSAPEDFRARLDTLLQQPDWIMDGHFAGTLAMRIAAADTVIWLDYSRWVCLGRVLWRVIGSYGRTRPDMAEGCPEKLDLEFLRFIWSFPQKHRPRIVAAIEAAGKGATLIQLKTPRETERMLASLP